MHSSQHAARIIVSNQVHACGPFLTYSVLGRYFTHRLVAEAASSALASNTHWTSIPFVFHTKSPPA